MLKSKMDNGCFNAMRVKNEPFRAYKEIQK